MLVRRHTTKLVTVTQVEHAALSLRLARHGPGEPRLHDGLSVAVEHHDDGWVEWDRAPGLDAGLPRDYRNMILQDHLTILNRSVERSRRLDPYAGWLVSRHGCSFHRGKTGEDVRAFLTEQRRIREKLEGNIPPTADREEDFNRLQFSDALSLFIIDPWAEEWSWDRDSPEPARVRAHGDRFRVYQEGWPPAPTRFTYRTRMIPPGPYDSRESLRRVLAEAPARTESVVLEGTRSA